MLDDERVELEDDISGVAELDIGGDALLERDEAELLEPPGHGPAAVLERELPECRPAPQLERADEERAPLLRSTHVARPRAAVEATRVEPLALDLEAVSRRAGDEHPGPSAFRSATIRPGRRRRRLRRVSP